jgi:zinc protease
LRDNNDAHFATRVALFELEKLLEDGLTQDQFEATRNFLDKFVAQLVSTQGRQLGYLLDSHYYGTPAFADYVRDGLAKLTVDDVNRAIRKHLRTENMQYVFITRDAEDLRARLVESRPSPMQYTTEMPETILAEDSLIEALETPFAEDAVEIVPAERLFE